MVLKMPKWVNDIYMYMRWICPFESNIHEWINIHKLLQVCHKTIYIIVYWGLVIDNSLV